jgi:Protein of unknown function (DUF3828)
MRFIALILAFIFCAASVHAGTRDNPLEMIKSIYAVYQTDSPQSDALKDIYSRRLRAAFEKDKRDTPKGEAGRLDWDFLVAGNDWDLSNVEIKLISRRGKRAQVLASFESFKKPHDVLFDLVIERGRWVIDEVRNGKTGEGATLSKILIGAPDAFGNEKQ